jgi:hypothetical protein
MVPSARQLDELVEEATVDCCNEEEQASGFFTMIEENLALRHPRPWRRGVGSLHHPRSLQISYVELFKQLKADVYGKEVQSAATYSYMWMADQMGHVCVGILVNQITTFGARYLWQFLGWRSFAEVAGLITAIASVAAWETSTFLRSEQSAKGLFPLGRELLRVNAIIATAYMALGAVVGFGFRIGILWSGWLSHGLNGSEQRIFSSASSALAKLSAESRGSAPLTQALRTHLQSGLTEY